MTDDEVRLADIRENDYAPSPEIVAFLLGYIDQQATDVEELRLLGRVMDRSIADLMAERNRMRAALEAIRDHEGAWSDVAQAALGITEGA